MHRRTKPSNKKFRNEKAISYFWVLVLAGDFNLDETHLILFEFLYKNDSKNLARQKNAKKPRANSTGSFQNIQEL